MVDLAFPVTGGSVPHDHRQALAEAIGRALPWLAGEAGTGVHRLNLSAGAGPRGLLSARTRLTLRLARDLVPAAGRLAGQALPVGDATLQVGAGQVRELRPWATLYAHLVASDPGQDEAAFLGRVDAELAALGVRGRPICGRAQVLEGGRLTGFSLMLDQLAPPDARRLLEAGLGRHRWLGCGLFVPHKSASALGGH